MFGKLRLKLISAIFILLCTQAALVYAAQGGLSLVSVTLMGGGEVQQAVEISSEPQFKVQFNKNVVNNSIWEDNSQCFSIVSANNENVPVMVSKLDDFSQRQIIFVQPEKPLNPDTVYYLNISPKLRAKNGAMLGGEKGEGISIAFKTMGETPEQPLQPTDEMKAQGVADDQ